MISLIVDEHKLNVMDTIRLLKDFDPDGTHLGCCTAAEALELAEQYPIDTALLDIEMPGERWIELAERLRRRYPRLNLLFLTSYEQYAVEAFRLNASSYLLKPVEPDALYAALNDLRYPVSSAPECRVYVKCFGSFEVYADRKPVIFKRSRSKEAFAFLIDRRGAMCTQSMLMGILYPDVEVTDSNIIAVRNYCTDISMTFEKLGVGDIIFKARGSIGLDITKIDSDYFRFLRGEPLAIHSFLGEYMREYEFARETEAALLWKSNLM